MRILTLSTEPFTPPTDRDMAPSARRTLAARMSGEALPAEVRPVIRAMADAEDRVVLRCRPHETFAQPPRHLHSNDQAEPVTHWVSATLPWDATDDHEGARA
jgi:hypothetical protein